MRTVQEVNARIQKLEREIERLKRTEVITGVPVNTVEEGRIYAYTCPSGIDLMNGGERFYAWTKDYEDTDTRISFLSHQATRDEDGYWWVQAGADVKIEQEDA